MVAKTALYRVERGAALTQTSNYGFDTNDDNDEEEEFPPIDKIIPRRSHVKNFEEEFANPQSMP
jgi:hypothetical protein